MRTAGGQAAGPLAAAWLLLRLLHPTLALRAPSSPQGRASPTYRPLLAVTGFWRVPDQYEDPLSQQFLEVPWNMRAVMTLNAPMVVYGDPMGLRALELARNGTNPPFVAEQEMPIQELVPCATHGHLILANKTKYTHPGLVPTVTLGCIWTSKIMLMQRAAERQPGYYWYAWVDVGMHAEKWDIIIRKSKKPWPDPQKLAELPKGKVTINRGTDDCSKCKKGRWWEFCHCVSPVTILIPAPIVQKVASLYFDKLLACMAYADAHDIGYPCLSEQVILTQVVLDHPGLFNIVGKNYDRIGHDLTSEMAVEPIKPGLFETMFDGNETRRMKI